MPRVILILLLLCQPFCLTAADLGFADPGLLTPEGTARARVVIVQDPAATRALGAQPDIVAAMVQRGLVGFTGQPTPAEAWRSLVKPDDVVGVKVHSSPGATSGTRPAVVAALIRSLLDAGHPADRIILWDRRLEDLRTAGFGQLAKTLGVRLAGAADSGFDPEAAYENPLLGQLVYGDLEFERERERAAGDPQRVTGRKSHLSRLLTKEITRHVIVAPLLNHPQAGVSGILYTTANASTDNFQRFEANPANMADAIPDIFGQPQIADRIALCVVDALVGQYEGSQRSWLHHASAVNELRFSTDPVALDVLSIEELNRIREAAGAPAITTRFPVYPNAHLLELGQNDPRKFEITRIDGASSGSETATPATPPPSPAPAPRPGP